MIRATLVALSVWATTAHAQFDPQALTQFQAGTPIRSAEMNANFGHLVEGGVALSAQVAALAETVAAQGAAQTALTERLTAAEAAATEAGTARAALADRLTETEARLTEAVEANQALAARVTALDAERAALIERVAALETQVTEDTQALGGRADALDQQVADLEQQALDIGNSARNANQAVTDLRESLVVSENTLVVDPTDGVGDFNDLQEAWDWLSTRRLAPGRTLFIRLRPGVYVHQRSLRLEHPDGGHIRIIGDSNDPSQVRLRFAGENGIVVSSGYSLGNLGGLTLDGEPAQAGNRGIAGLNVSGGATLSLGRGVVITRFINGAVVTTGGQLIGSDDFRIIGSELRGLWVNRGALADVSDVQIIDSGIDGMTVDQGSVVIATNCVLEGNGASGALISINSVANLSNCTVEGNDNWGARVDTGSVVRMTGATVQQNGLAGLELRSGSFGTVSSSQLIGNNTNGSNDQAQLVVKRSAQAAIGGTFEAIGNRLLLPAAESDRIERPISGENQ